MAFRRFSKRKLPWAREFRVGRGTFETDLLFKGRLESQAPGIDGRVLINDYEGLERPDDLEAAPSPRYGGIVSEATGPRLVQIKPRRPRAGTLTNHALSYLAKKSWRKAIPSGRSVAKGAS